MSGDESPPDSGRVDGLLHQNKLESESSLPWSGQAGLRVASLVAGAGMLIAAGGGYFIGARSANQQIVSSASIAESLGFARAVASYQAFYVRETVNGTRDNNVERLSARLLEENNLKLNVPDFSARGLEFVRARQLAYAGQPVVQRVYLGDSGLPVAFCFMPLNDGPDASDAMYKNHFGLETVE